MAEFLMAAAGFVLAMVALGLARLLYGPANADRIMGAQLLGSGGIAALLLWGTATETPGVSDLALVLALLAAFASIAFVVSGSSAVRRRPRAAEHE
ncbi:MAG TPA: monovalent cation/H+ antiporter complex subunit F [Hyphomicrobiaceae bacterium]|jgi:multicomponent Na+:H+ antiporter subunit F|nr:monovalent cation/H+ antiporter complex subunit F [Hyphomicrobiaceae bacterium]